MMTVRQPVSRGVVINDPVLGRLVRGVRWDGRVFVSALNRHVPIFIHEPHNAPGQRPAKWQREIVREFINAPSTDLRNRIEQSLYDYHVRLAGDNDVADLNVASLRRPKDVWRLVRRPKIFIGPVVDDTAKIAIAWN